MIARIWHGWTEPDQADQYERLLNESVLPGIAAREIPGYVGVDLLRRNLGTEIEFVTIMWFDSWEAVKAFAGDDHEHAYVPPDARAVLSRFDATSRHYVVAERFRYS